MARAWGSWRGAFALMACFVLGSCGARTGLGDGDGAAVTDVPTATIETEEDTDPSGRGRGRDRPLFESEALLDCVLGQDVREAEMCRWLVDRRCYETLDEACACACPRTGNSTCTGGLFEDARGAIEVTCE